MASLLAGCSTTQPIAQPAVPVKREKQLFIVIDDAGMDMMRLRPFLELPVPVTVAIMPSRKYTQDTRNIMAKYYPSKEYILHQPMQPISETADPGKGAILDYMEPGQIPWTLDRNLAQIPGAKGMNNHMGSKITSNPAMMEVILKYCKAHHLYFLDSLTTPDSVVKKVAKKVGTHYEQRHVFLDNERTEEAITAQFEEAATISRENGYAIMIGHAWSPETAVVLKKACAFAEREGFTFHVISELFNEVDPAEILLQEPAPAAEVAIETE
jgi:polysaccharide deacetylase 2 family uncharacterized protein YibQ